MNSAVSTAAWLQAWEAAAGLRPGWREAALLQPACEGLPEGAAGLSWLADLPLGRRDDLLLSVRQALFGSQMACVARCPACGEACEWEAPVDALRVLLPEGAGDTGPRLLEHEGWRLHYRCITGADLAALPAMANAEALHRALLARCVLQVSHDGQEAAPSALPDSLARALGEALAEADPQAAPAVALQCPACGEAWEAEVDIGAFLWAELDAWAQRTLADVHTLASRYGWTEPEVLALSPARRAHYLALGDA